MPDDFQSVQKAMTAWLREPDQTPPPALERRRLEIYRELVHNNIRDFVESAYPVLKSLLPQAEWEGLLGRFIAEHRAQSPYFRDISLEFRQWMEATRTEWLAARPWARELMHFEWVELAADCAETAPDTTACTPDGDLLAGIPCLRNAVWPLVYRWPVHAFSAEHPPADTPPAQAVCLLVYRDADEEVRFLEINPLAARLVELLQGDEPATGDILLRRLATEAGTVTEAGIAAFVTAGAGLLEELRCAGIIRGAQA